MANNHHQHSWYQQQQNAFGHGGVPQNNSGNSFSPSFNQNLNASTPLTQQPSAGHGTNASPQAMDWQTTGGSPQGAAASASASASGSATVMNWPSSQNSGGGFVAPPNQPHGGQNQQYTSYASGQQQPQGAGGAQILGQQQGHLSQNPAPPAMAAFHQGSGSQGLPSAAPPAMAPQPAPGAGAYYASGTGGTPNHNTAPATALQQTSPGVPPQSAPGFPPQWYVHGNHTPHQSLNGGQPSFHQQQGGAHANNGVLSPTNHQQAATVAMLTFAAPAPKQQQQQQQQQQQFIYASQQKAPPAFYGFNQQQSTQHQNPQVLSTPSHSSGWNNTGGSPTNHQHTLPTNHGSYNHGSYQGSPAPAPQGVGNQNLKPAPPSSNLKPAPPNSATPATFQCTGNPPTAKKHVSPGLQFDPLRPAGTAPPQGSNTVASLPPSVAGSGNMTERAQDAETLKRQLWREVNLRIQMEKRYETGVKAWETSKAKSSNCRLTTASLKQQLSENETKQKECDEDEKAKQKDVKEMEADGDKQRLQIHALIQKLIQVDPAAVEGLYVPCSLKDFAVDVLVPYDQRATHNDDGIKSELARLSNNEQYDELHGMAMCFDMESIRRIYKLETDKAVLKLGTNGSEDLQKIARMARRAGLQEHPDFKRRLAEEFKYPRDKRRLLYLLEETQFESIEEIMEYGDRVAAFKNKKGIQCFSKIKHHMLKYGHTQLSDLVEHIICLVGAHRTVDGQQP